MYQNYVIKFELIPETEELIYQKLGAFNGNLVTKRVKISDLEYVAFDDLY